MFDSQRYWMVGLLGLAACAPDTVTPAATPATSKVVSAPTVVSAQAGQPALSSAAPIVAAAPAAAPTAPAPVAAAPLPAAAIPARAAAGAPAVHTEGMHGAAGTPAEIKPATPSTGTGAVAGASKADAFCDKYEKNCGFGKPQRHADRAACITDFNATPAQQACKNMHIDTAIAGTAAACNGMPSEFCFAIHCLHAAGIADQTGVTYCK